MRVKVEPVALMLPPELTSMTDEPLALLSLKAVSSAVRSPLTWMDCEL